MDPALHLLRAEALASKLEGILLADPALAALWRMEASLLEAAATVGLESERVSTPAMVLRLTDLDVAMKDMDNVVRKAGKREG